MPLAHEPPTTTGGSLSVAHCVQGDEFMLRNHVMEEPVLLLWLSDAPEIRLEYGGRQWTLRPRPGHFDYYPSGVYPLVCGRSSATLGLKMGLGHRWRTVLGLADSAIDARPWFQFGDRRLMRLAREFLRRMDARPGGTCELPRIYLELAVLACLAERFAATPSSPRAEGFSEPMSRLVRRVVDDALADELPVDTLAALTGYGEAQFLRRFKASFRMPPHRYILRRRVERAKEMMRDADRSLTAIAHELGFASHAHFTTAFKSQTGTTPSAFRMHA